MEAPPPRTAEAKPTLRATGFERTVIHYFKQVLQITSRLEVRAMVSQGADGVMLFELETTAPAAATTLVTESHHIENGKISTVQSVLDGGPV